MHFADSIRATLNLVAGILAEKKATGIGNAGSIGWTVAISGGTRVRVATSIIALDVRVANKVRWTSACKGTQRVRAVSQFMAWVSLTKSNGSTSAAIWIAGKSGQALAVGIVRVCNADSVVGAPVDAWIVAEILCRAGAIQGTVLVGDALHAETSLGLVVGTADKKTHQWAAALSYAVLHYAERILATVVVMAAVDAAANAVTIG